MEGFLDSVWPYLAVWLPLYLPLGIIGGWRWGVWLLKKMVAVFYRPSQGSFEGKVSVVTPVYNENPEIFEKALQSWQANQVNEIVAVIDYTDQSSIDVFTKFSKQFPGAKLIITQTPGKRPALVEGVRAASHEIVALVDSDTMWSAQVRQEALRPFADERVGGVGTRQNILEPRTIAERIFDIQLDQRYLEEFPFLMAMNGSVVTCLSGRTAFYRRAVVLPLLNDLVNETFWGKPVISGEDKRLTYLMQAEGWKAKWQQSAVVFTPGSPSLRTFLKQRLRWSRNSWRADLRALSQTWTWRHPDFVLYQIDRSLQPFAQLLSPIYFVVSILLGLWLPAVILIVWWHVSRTIRLWSHLRRRPQDLWLIPIYIPLSFYLAVNKIYALVTLNRQGWITRWHASRLPSPQTWLAWGVSYTAVVAMLLSLGGTVWWHNHDNFRYSVAPAIAQSYSQLLPPSLMVAEEFSGQPDSGTNFSGREFFRYEVQAGDNLVTLAERFGVTEDRLVAANEALLPSRTALLAGLVLTIPAAGAELPEEGRYVSEYQQLGPLSIIYDHGTNTISASGRGQIVGLHDLVKAGMGSYLKQVSQKEWLLTANLHLKTGVTLKLSDHEVGWLKLASSPQGFVWVKADNGVVLIKGVKITSWDAAAGEVDKELKDGRSYVAVSRHSRLDVFDSELGYLGYESESGDSGATSGVAWVVPSQAEGRPILTGEVRGSHFYHNYDGLYWGGVRGASWVDSQANDNVRFGLHITRASEGTTVERGFIHNNGQTGILITKHSQENSIHESIIQRHAAPGIQVIGSSRNGIKNTTLAHNQAGIMLDSARDNRLEGNNIYSNERGVVVNAESHANVLRGNTMIRHPEAAIILEGGAEYNIVSSNKLSANGVGLYIKGSNNRLFENKIEFNVVGVYFLEQAHDNILVDNHITDHQEAGVYTRTSQAVHNMIGNNSLSGNRVSIAARW